MSAPSPIWLTNVETRLLDMLKKFSASRFDPIHNISSLSDWHDHSIVRFEWKYMRGFANARLEPGYVAVYADKLYLLDSDQAFVRFLTDNRLQISPSTKNHLAIALECAVLGWTSRKKRIDTWQELEAEALTLTPFFKKQLHRRIEPPYFGETGTTRYLAIWMYHSRIQDMLVRWVASQSKKDASEAQVRRDVQIVAAGVD